MSISAMNVLHYSNQIIEEETEQIKPIEQK